jgi:DnaK suppressor protein
VNTTSAKKTVKKASAPAGKAATKKPVPAKPAKAPPAAKKAAAPAPATAKKAPAPKAAKPEAAARTAPPPAPKPAAPAATPAAGTVVAPAAKVAAVAPPVMPAGVVPRKPGRGTPKYFVAPVQAPLPAPTSRFADRFAPPRPPTRQMNKPEDGAPRQAHKSDPKLVNAWKTKAGRDLTEAEVLAMPDSEYMNEKQLEFFRMTLQTLKDDLLSNAGETTEHLREDTSIVPDPADRATIEEEHALELRTRDRERKLLKKISQSLGRIESGEYGFCDETGEPIGLGRLIARPTATLSLEAQQRRELKQKMFGD